MPELAEVEYYRKRWDPGLRKRITRVAVHPHARVLRGSDPLELVNTLTGARPLSSETRGKQMLFRFSHGGWLGVHLGMTGELHVAPRDFAPGRHDHLVLYQAKQALVFTDARMFGRLRFHHGRRVPKWWSDLPPAVTAKEFTRAYLEGVLRRRSRAPLKALLLDQDVFPGLGNWMADEILWQAKLPPQGKGAQLSAAQRRALWSIARKVCRVALRTIGVDWGDPPKGWLLHERFARKGRCPRHGTPLTRQTVAGRTTAWCAKCQPPLRGRS